MSDDFYLRKLGIQCVTSVAVLCVLCFTTCGMYQQHEQAAEEHEKWLREIVVRDTETAARDRVMFEVMRHEQLKKDDEEKKPWVMP